MNIIFPKHVEPFLFIIVYVLLFPSGKKHNTNSVCHTSPKLHRFCSGNSIMFLGQS